MVTHETFGIGLPGKRHQFFPHRPEHIAADDVISQPAVDNGERIVIFYMDIGNVDQFPCGTLLARIKIKCEEVFRTVEICHGGISESY